VVLVGDDEIVPMARLVDPTRLGNEAGYAAVFDPETPFHQLLATSHFPSDAPYGDLDPIPWLDRQLYVPDLSTGRLLGGPDGIAAAVQAFVDSGGAFDPATTYAAGYDFMQDGVVGFAEAATRALAAAGGDAPELIEPADGWTSEEVLGGLDTDEPRLTALYGHFDHEAGLSAAGWEQGTDDTMTAAELADALPTGTSVALSMGCHSGLPVPESGEDPAVADDLSTAASADGRIWIGVTGFGYGDDGVVGLHERLFELYAGQLDGALSVGEALTAAEQEYFGTMGVYGMYDEKVLESTAFFGLPMYRVGSGDASRPATGLVPGDTGAPYSVASVQLRPQFDAVTRSDGATFYRAANGPTGPFESPQATQGRPVQPRLVQEVSNIGPMEGVAHGALITGLHTMLETDLEATYSTAVLRDVSGPSVGFGEVAFPGRMATVTTASDPNGVGPGADDDPHQRLVVVAGQFFGHIGTRVGTQRLFDEVDVDVLYSTADDWEAPAITAVRSATEGETAVITVEADDAGGVDRIVVVADSGGPTWVAVDLTALGDGRWVGGLELPAGATATYFVQAVDQAGNVAVTSNKGRLYQAG
jgi:hypothetical protein